MVELAADEFAIFPSPFLYRISLVIAHDKFAVAVQFPIFILAHVHTAVIPNPSAETVWHSHIEISFVNIGVVQGTFCHSSYSMWYPLALLIHQHFLRRPNSFLPLKISQDGQHLFSFMYHFTIFNHLHLTMIYAIMPFQSLHLFVHIAA